MNQGIARPGICGSPAFPARAGAGHIRTFFPGPMILSSRENRLESTGFPIVTSDTRPVFSGILKLAIRLFFENVQQRSRTFSGKAETSLFSVFIAGNGGKGMPSPPYFACRQGTYPP